MALSGQGQTHSTRHDTFAPWVRVSSDRHTSGSTAPPHLGSTRYSAKLVEDMASINHGPWGPARAQRELEGLQPVYRSRRGTARPSVPRHESPNTNTQHTSQHCMMACQFTGACHVGDNTRDGSAPVTSSCRERQAGIATESGVATSIYGSKKTKTKNKTKNL